MWNNVVITVEGLLWLCGAIALIGGAIALVVKFFAPFCDLKKRVTALEQKFEGDHAELKKVKIGIEKICNILLTEK